MNAEGPLFLWGYDSSRVVSVTTCGSSEMFKPGLDPQYSSEITALPGGK